ncbi:MAG: hypothetical protein IJG84_05005 [Kiritimatiellae bacterium]|nr:hypothetical protein [Kiritimatiellia bacterium]
MKLKVASLRRLGVCCLAWTSVCGAVFATEFPTVKVKWFETAITPEIGTLIAGYEEHDVSTSKFDDLMAIGLCVNDGSNKVMLVSLDLIGLDAESIAEIRRRVSAATGVPAGGVMVTCTHTHQGPHTRIYSRRNAITGEKTAYDDRPGSIDSQYMEFLFARIEEAAKGLEAREWEPCSVGYYSQSCDENRNRRYTTSENRASFNAHRPFLHRITDGIADKELGTVVFLDKDFRPVYVIGNYAAHALTAHAPGAGGLRISSDFPGFYRRYIRTETGAKAMFVQGAAGDLVTKDDECGSAAARKVGENLAMASITGIISVQRCYERYGLAKPRVGWDLRSFTSPLRRKWREMTGNAEQSFDVQCLAIGDVCFVGFPGELVSELGLEVKWNSPFARTYIAYLATGYCGYIVPPNLMAAGGYEAQSQRFASRDVLKMVKTASDAMFDLRSRLFPEDDVGDDPYPDNRNAPLVDVPGMHKGSKWDR